jgi:hypothetical protein
MVVRVDYVPHFWFFTLFSLFLGGGAVLIALDHFALIHSKHDPLLLGGLFIFGIYTVFRHAYFCSFMLESDGTALVVKRIWGGTRRYAIEQLRELDFDAIKRMQRTSLKWTSPSLMIRTVSGASIPLFATGAEWRRARAADMAEVLGSAVQAHLHRCATGNAPAGSKRSRG